MVVEGRWLAMLAAARALEHLVLGGAFAAIAIDQVFGEGLSIEPLMRSIYSLL